MARKPDSTRNRPVDLPLGPTTVPPRDAVFEELLRTVSLDALPAPPSDGPAWRERVAAIDRRVPGLGAYMADIPIGWFSLLERATGLIPALLGRDARLCTRQTKEKLATLRWYAHVELVSGDWDGRHAALGAIEWTEHASGQVCSLYGTADGTLDASQFWLLTLSERAQLEREEQGVEFGRRLYPAWTYD